jgi:hypothetical protein
MKKNAGHDTILIQRPNISAERTSVGATEQLAKRRVFLKRVDEQPPLANGKMPSPMSRETGPDHR